jgi:hypothetical protein
VNTLTVNGITVEFKEMDEDTGLIRFQLDNTWRDPLDFIVPGCTALEYIMRLHTLGTGFWSKELKGPASNGEVRRWLENSAVRFNGKPLKPKDRLDFPLYSVVMFPKANRITLL